MCMATGSNYIVRKLTDRTALLKIPFLVCVLLVLIVNNYAYAQYQITQSRFMTGADPFSQTCSIGNGNSVSDCMPDVNGVVYMRFDTESLRIDDSGTPDDIIDDRLEFVVQVRKTGEALPYSVGGMAVNYNVKAFGENLNEPAFYNNDTDTATNLGQCTYTKGDIFTGSQNYVFTFRDTSPSLLSLFAEAADFTSVQATSSSFSTINNEWQDFATLSCQIVYDANNNGTVDANEGNINADAGLAFSSRLWAENQVWITSDEDTSTANRIVFGIANNDLRGFRLDGKTWVEDYARHDDGKGVRLRFSKGVAAYNEGDTTPMQLTPANFTINGAGEAMSIITATHQVNEPYVNLRFESAVSNGILRLISTNTRIVKDVDNVELADQNFAAALVHDTDAPYVTEVRRASYAGEDGIGQSTWEISFSEALSPDTVSKENLCLTDSNGICASADKPATTPTIVSVDLNDENSIITVVINEGRIGQASSPISLEFRRNAVLGEDFKIVEDYQTALRDTITLSDDEPLEITVRAIDMRVDVNPDPNIETIYPFEAVPDIGIPSTPNGNRYTMQFAVQANRPILGINDESSYQLIAVPIDENEPVLASSMTITLEAVNRSRSGDATTLTYVVELDSVAATQRIQGFTLARGTNNDFMDINGNPPAVNVGNVLDSAPRAIARRDTQRPSISVVQVANAINANGYSLRFNISANEVLRPPVETDFTLLRQLEGGSYAVVTSPVDFSINDVNTSSYIVTTRVRLSEAEARNTVGLTLGDGGGGVRDLANNDPITIGTERLFDDSDEALATTHQTHPSISVVAQGTATPDENDPLVYRGAFEVTANTTLDTGISGSNGIVGLADGASYWVLYIPSDGSEPSTQTAQIVEMEVTDTSATISFATRFANSSEAMQTMGFTLARRDNLQDFASNTPVDPVNTEDEIVRGDRLDSRDRAVALRDSAPIYTVAREGELTIAASGYTMAFRVSAPSDVPATQSSDLRQSGSYSLLRKLQGSDTYEVMPGRLIDEITVMTTRTVIVRYTNIPRLSIGDAVNSEGFTLGRSADNRLRDLASNDPVVSIDGATPTEVTTTPPLPLDASGQALFTIERDSPSLTVVPNGAIAKNGTTYRGSFNVNNTEEGIDGIESSASYVLLRVEQRIDDMPTTAVVLPNANISVGSANFNDLIVVSIHFSVDDPDATSTHSFTLGRRERLSDLVGNPLVDPADNSVVTTNSRIDSRPFAEARIPADNTPNPIISVVAENGRVIADTSNPLRYTGSFDVSVINDKDVSGIRNAGSYNLLRIARDGTHTTAAAMLQVNDATTADVLEQMATVVFSTTLTATSIRQTYGFTLGRRANLIDASNNPPLVDASREDRLDASAAAVAILDRSLQITAEAIVDTSEALTRLPPFDQPNGPKAYPQVNFADSTVNGNRYSMVFEVRSLNGEAISGIGSTSSYVLLHVPTTGTAIDLSGISENTIEMVSFDQTQARVRYTVEFGSADDAEALALTQRTAGFILGRAMGALQEGDVQPLDSDGNFIADDAPINPSDTAIARRDTTSPAIMVMAVVSNIESDGIDIDFTLRTDSDESLQPQWNAEDDFVVLLRRLSTPGWDIATGYGQSVTISGDIGSARDFSIFDYRLSQNDALDAEGFTLGYNRGSTLRDLSNNEVIQGGTTQTALMMGQPFDIRDAAFVLRDMNPPFIRVTASTPTVIDAQRDSTSYDIVFEVASKKLEDDNEIDALVLGLRSPASYQLLREIGEENYEVVTSGTYVARGERISEHRARIIYENVRLSIPQVQETLSFTIGRAPSNPDDVDDCPLCDYWSNASVVVGTTQIVTAGIPLDRSETAEAGMVDQTGEMITVSAIGDAVPDRRNPNIYNGSFEVRSSDTVSSLNDARSYTLLRLPRVGADGFADGFADSFSDAMETTATLTLSVDSSTTFTRITFTVDLNDIAITQRTYGFTLGRAGPSIENDCVLCDSSGKLPVNREGTIILAGSPLDTTTMAIVRRDIESPRITVMASSLNRTGNNYNGSFDVSSEESIDGIESSASYVLLRVRRGEQDMMLDNTEIGISIADLNNLRSATIHFSVEGAVATDGDSFTLGRNARLADLSGNTPVDPADANNPIGIGERIDSRGDAEIAVPANDTDNPIITVRADGDAIPSVNNRLMYRGSFNVASNEQVTKLNDKASYRLLHLTTDGATTEIAARILDPVSLGQFQVRVTFATTLTSMNVNETIGFTLGRRANLIDESNNRPQVGVAGRLDTSPDAIARLGRLIQITSEAIVDTSHYLSDLIPFNQDNDPKAYPKVDNADDTDVNGNRYSMVFEVRSLEDEVVSDIASTNSYVIIHVPTTGTAIDLYHPNYIVANSVEIITTDTHVRVRYTVEFGAADDEDATVNLTQRTAGFVLGRAMGALQDGDMLPLDNDGNPIGDDARINPRTTAIAARDTQSPTVLVNNANISQDSNGFVLSFGLRTNSGEALNPQWQTQSRSGILRVNTGTSTYRLVTRANTNVSTDTSISSSLRLSSDAFRLSESEARETDGFTAGYIGTLGESTLRDLSNNDVYQGGTTRAITSNQPFDRRDDAIAVRDMIAPFIEVNASTATVASVRLDSVTYDMSFDVAAMQQNGEQKVAAAGVRGLDSATSYQLLRVLTGDRLVAVQNQSIPSSSAISISVNQATISFSVRVPESEIDNTVGFTLTRALSDPDDPNGCPLCDFASNAPLVANTTETIVGTLTMPADGFKPLDPRDTAIANIDMPDAISAPTLTVTASDAMPSLDNGDEYTMNFVVQSDQPISGNLGLLEAYRLIHRPTTGTALALSRENGLITDSSLTINDANNSVTVSYTVRFTDTENQTQRTAGFTLAANQVLRDMLTNRAMNRAGEAIDIGTEIDTTPTAVARRDTQPPIYTVAREGELTIAASGYTMAFRVSAPSDVPATQSSDLRQSGSYSLLRKLQGSDTYEVMPGRLIDEITVMTTRTVIVRYTNIPRLSIGDAVNSEGFTLGRSADDRLRDLASNDPVVSIDGATPAEVTTTPPLPLDASGQALFTIERDSPSLTVAPNGAIAKNDDMYRGSFNVSSTNGEGIDGIESSASYVLLRVEQRIDDMPTTAVVLPNANISVGSANFNDLRTVAIYFDVNDSDADANANAQVYTLGRRDRLSDLVGNPLVDAATNEEVTTNGRIDSRETAEAPIPTVNTLNPIISIVAENGRAIADTSNPLRYIGSFDVSVINDKDVSGIRNAGSYNLLRIARDGTHTTAAAMLQVNEPTDANMLGQMATVVFSTTLTVASLQQTYGFTLGRRNNLETSDDPPIPPLVDASRENRLDAAAAAVAVLDRSLQIIAEAIVDTSEALTRLPPFDQPDGPKAYPQVNFADSTVNGNRYSMIFEVRSLNGEAISGIGSTSSYVLLHVPTTGTAIDLSGISENTVEMVSFDQTQARVRYTVEFGAADNAEALALTQRTAGFILGRAMGALQEGDMQPLDSDGNFIADDAPINPSDTAIARRDTTSPAIMVMAVVSNIESDGIDIDFTLRTDSDESLQPQWNAEDDFVVLLRRLSTPGWDIATGYGQSVTISGDIGSARDFSIFDYRLSQNDALDAEGFTLGYNRGSTLRDLSNNDVIQGGTTQTALMMGQPFDIRDAAFVPRDMNPPFIRVTASTPTVIDAQRDSTSYDIVFEVASKKLEDDNEIDALVLGLRSPASYQLLREIGEENYEVVTSDTYVARGERISEHRARIIYENVRLSIPQVQQTLSFTIGRAPSNPDDVDDCPLCDYWSNAPVVVGTTQIATAGIPLDRRNTANARIEDKTGEMIMVSAVGDAVPDRRNPNIYSGSFEVNSDSLVRGLSDVRSYTLLRLPRVGGNGFGEAEETAVTPILSVDNSTTLSARINFMVDLDTIAITQRTYGFTLGRASPSIGNDCALCDSSNNLPVDRDGMIVPVGAPLDATTMAIARRDIVPPRIAVTPIGEFVNVQPNRYIMRFRVTAPPDVADTLGSELRALSTYRLLRRLNTDNSYQMVPVVPSQTISPSGNIELVYGDVLPLTIEEISKTESFTLGLAIAGRLRDKSGNDPVVSVGGASVTVDPPSPLDEGTTAHLLVSRVGNPAISVTHNQNSTVLTKKGAVYTGTFDLDASRSIDGIASTESYVLLRVPQRTNTTMPDAPVVVLNNAHIGVSGANFNNLQSAKIYFAVDDPDATSKHSFALGRKARLTDLVGNRLIDPADDSLVEINERIDSRLSAEVAVPSTDTQNPIITVAANGKAIPSPDNRLEYIGSFRVSSDAIVSGFDRSDSYELLHIDDEDTHTTIVASISANTAELAPALGEAIVVRVSFRTELSAEQLLKTTGFTLGRRANLQQEDTPPIVDESRQNRLDASDNAIAKIDRPLLINAEAIVDTQNPLVRDNLVSDNIKAYPDVGNGNKYSMVFRVRSETGDAIPDIGSTSSYVLLHIPTPDAEVVDDLSPYITSNTVEMISSNNTEAKVKYTVTFGEDDSTTAHKIALDTAGFALGRVAGSLQIATTKPLDRLRNLIADGARINPSTAGIAVRDTTAPEIEIAVIVNSADINGFVLSFEASTPPLEILRAGGNNANNYAILRRLEGGRQIAVADTQIGVVARRQLDNVRTINVVPFHLDQNEAQQTLGFTLAYGGASAIRDLANNDAVRFASTQSLIINRPFDDRDSALAVRNTNPPFVEVRAQEIVPADGGENALPGGYYRLAFDVDYRKIVNGQLVAVPLHNNRRSYQLLRQTTADEFELVRNSGTLSYSSGISNAMLSYDGVYLSPEEIAQTRSFTLGRAPNDLNADQYADRCRLCDYFANAPVMAGTTRMVMIGEPLDATDRARTVIPRTMAALRVSAVGIAEPDLANGNVYTMNFRVESDEPITGLGSLASYDLIHKPTDGEALDLTTFTDDRRITVNSSATEAMLFYKVVFTDVENQTQRTAGFTLARNARLVDSFGNPANNRQGEPIAIGEEINTTSVAIALRDTEPPRIAVNAKRRKATETTRGSSIYDMQFVVTVSNGEQVRGLNDVNSYTLLQILKDGTVMFPSSTATATIINEGIEISHSGVRISQDDSNPTIAFTLGRSDTNLRDLANNDPVDANPENATDKIDEADEELDSRTSALARIIRAILIRAKVFLEGPLQ